MWWWICRIDNVCSLTQFINCDCTNGYWRLYEVIATDFTGNDRKRSSGDLIYPKKSSSRGLYEYNIGFSKTLQNCISWENFLCRFILLESELGGAAWRNLYRINTCNGFIYPIRGSLNWNCNNCAECCLLEK